MSFEFNKDVSFVLGKTYVKYHFQALSEPLVFLFSPSQTEIPPDNVRDTISPWGFPTIKRLKLNVMSFTSLQPRNWYRHPVLNQYLNVQLPEMLPAFPARLGIGADVGGFGMSLYANSLQCQRILLFNPISTLNQELAPWETRYPHGARNMNWKKGDIDGSISSCPGQLIYDKKNQLDHLHALRYGSQLKRINARGMGEKVSKHLQTMKLFEKTIMAFVQDELTANSFHTSLRCKRQYLHYYHALLHQDPKRLTLGRESIIEERLLSCVRAYANDPQVIQYRDASLLRDLAARIKNKDLTLAEHLMTQARQLRKN